MIGLIDCCRTDTETHVQLLQQTGAMFIGAIVLIVLVALCAVLGAIYSYLYFTRINPRGGRKLAGLSGGGGSEGGGGGGGGATHMFLFR